MLCLNRIEVVIVFLLDSIEVVIILLSSHIHGNIGILFLLWSLFLWQRSGAVSNFYWLLFLFIFLDLFCPFQVRISSFFGRSFHFNIDHFLRVAWDLISQQKIN